MASSKRRTHFYAIIGISLVLLVLGVAGIIGIEIKRIEKNLKENLLVQIELNDSLNTAAIAQLQATIKGKYYVKNLKFVTREEAMKLLVETDSMAAYQDLLDHNPLYNSFLINLNQGYANADSMQLVRAELAKMEGVDSVEFADAVLESLTRNIARFSFILIVIAGFLLAFAVSLIFNTIRLAMFSNRFTIKTMQLFGATRWFIIKPFLGRSIVNGLLSGLLACLLLVGGIWYFDYSMPDLALQHDLVTFAVLFGVLVLFGIIISFFSTLTAVSRYLRIKVEDLY